jgi:hypothetical protein
LNNLKKKFVAKPIEIPKPTKGTQYFFAGIFIFTNGNKHTNTINILKLPIRRGGTELLKIILPTGYEVPNRKVIKIISK